MSKIFKDITETIGRTPLVRINKITKNIESEIVAKIESLNPMSSIKDRVGLSLIDDAENRGLIKKDTIIVEPTSGNTGIALAFICAARSYKLILTMPDSMSVERRKLLSTLGAELILTPGEDGMNGAIKEAEEFVKKNKNSIILQQFENEANSEIHKKTTALEIIEDTDGEIDFFISAVGTGGTITGVGEVLKKFNENIKVIAVEPEKSAVLSGEEAGPHKIQGIGAGFIPKVLNRDIYDEVLKISDEEAAKYSRLLAKEEGILVGISSGAIMAAAMEVSKREESIGKRIVVVFPDSGERYLSTWLFE